MLDSSNKSIMYKLHTYTHQAYPRVIVEAGSLNVNIGDCGTKRLTLTNSTAVHGKQHQQQGNGQRCSSGTSSQAHYSQPLSTTTHGNNSHSKLFRNVISATSRLKIRGDNESLNAVHYLRVFLNVAYFFCYIPFRFVPNSNGGYKIHSNMVHQVMVGVNHFFALARFLTAIRETSLLEAHWNPAMYFELARNFATCVYMSTFVWIFWTKRNLFTRIFSELQHYHAQFHSNNNTNINITSSTPCHFSDKNHTAQVHRCKQRIRIPIVVQAFCLCFIYTLISTLNVLLGAGVIETFQWTPSFLFSSYAGQGKFMFFLQNNKTEVPWKEFTPSLYVFTTVQIIIQFYFKIGAHYADLSILVTALTLRNLATNFSNCIRNRNFGAPQILEHYQMLKKVAKSINTAIGPITLCAILEAMPYYATHIGDILFLPDLWGKFRYLFFVVNFFSILIIAADTTQKVGELKEWLGQDSNCNSINQSKLVVLLNELSSNCPVGLSAMGLLTITYGFIGTLVSVVITYAVIILQFKSSVGTCRPQVVDNIGT